MAQETKIRLKLLDGTPVGGEHRKAGEIVTVDHREAMILLGYKKAVRAPLEKPVDAPNSPGVVTLEVNADPAPTPIPGEKPSPKESEKAPEGEGATLEGTGQEPTPEDGLEDGGADDPLADNGDAPLEGDPVLLTREELLEQAKALGLNPQPNTGEAKLRKMIESATKKEGN